jgi:hypothetical protein
MRRSWSGLPGASVVAVWATAPSIATLDTNKTTAPAVTPRKLSIAFSIADSPAHGRTDRRDLSVTQLRIFWRKARTEIGQP